MTTREHIGRELPISFAHFVREVRKIYVPTAPSIVGGRLIVRQRLIANGTIDRKHLRASGTIGKRQPAFSRFAVLQSICTGSEAAGLESGLQMHANVRKDSGRCGRVMPSCD